MFNMNDFTDYSLSYTRASTFHTTQTLPPSSNNNTPKHRSDFHKKTVFANFSQNKQTPNSSIQHLQSTLKIKSAINILFLDAHSHRIADRVSFNDTIAPSFPDQSFKEMIQIVQGKTRHTNKNTHSMNNCSMNENTVKLDASSLASAQSIKMKDAGFNSGLNVVKNGIIPTFGMTLEHNHSSFSYKQSSFDYMQSVNKNFKESSTHSGNKCSKLELNENKIGYLHELFGVLNPINENDDIQTQSNVIRTTTLENVVKKESKKAQSYRSKQTGRVFLTNLNQTLYNDSFSNTSKSSSRSQNTRKVNIHSVKSIVYSCYNGNINLQVMNARNKCDDRYSRFGGNEQILLIRKDECSSMTRKSPIYHHTYVLEVQLDKLFDSSLKSYPINDTNSPSFSQYLTNKGIEAEISNLPSSSFNRQQEESRDSRIHLMKTSFNSALGFKQAGTLHSTTSTLAHPSSINKKVMFVKESANSKTPIQYKSMDPQETNSASSPSIKSIKSKKSTIAGDSMNDIVKSFTFTTTSKVQRKRAVDRSKSSRDMCFFCEYEQYFGGRFWMKRKMNKISS